jgi:very-long-chain enoyl-CoA reductase
MQIEIFDAKTQKLLTTLTNVGRNDSIYNIKEHISQKKSYLYPSRQSLRTEPRGKNLNDEETLVSLKLPATGAQLYLRDLGPQISWRTVFLLEYFGPCVIYPLFYLRPKIIYGNSDGIATPTVVSIACVCYTAHFVKRLLETVFFHRFSHATMPYLNVFKNSGYYWGFAVFIGYYANHPLYTPPCFGAPQIAVGLIGFILSEYGNFSIHLALRNLRPAGSKERKIPTPTGDPFTKMFSYVSCPNYTYEVLSWLSFSVMTQLTPALIFTAFGFYQMAVWAIGKHKLYKKEFPHYPRNRKAIIPFLL